MEEWVSGCGALSEHIDGALVLDCAIQSFILLSLDFSADLVLALSHNTFYR